MRSKNSVAIISAAEAGIGIAIRGGVARGEPGEGSGSRELWDLWQQANLDELLQGMTATEFMLRFTITKPYMHTTIVGTLSPAHLQANLSATD